MSQEKRCAWVPIDNQLYLDYHDNEWGRYTSDDRQHFELLVLEGAQAGLSWLTILRKRRGYRELFHDFDVAKVAAMSDAELERCLKNPAIVRNRAKVYAARTNARCFQEIVAEHGSFIAFVERTIGFRKRNNAYRHHAETPAQSPESQVLARELARHGMKFVGSTVIYSYMQATGIVNDHLVDCVCYSQCN